MRRNLLAVVFSAVSIAGMLFAATPEAQAAVGTTTTVSLSKPSIAYGAGANETITVVVTDASTAKPAGTVAITVPGITGTIPSITIGAGGTCSSTGTYQRTCTGTATVPAATAGGTYTVTATYTPTSNAFSGSFGTTSLTITPVAATAALGAQPNGTYGGTVTLSATNSGLSGGAAPTGVPTFTVNGTATGGTPACSASGAVETCTLSYQLPPALTPTNSYTDSVSFAADANYATSTASSTVTVGKATPVASIPGVSGGFQKNVPLTETNTGAGAAYAAPTGVPTVTVGTQNQNRAKACTEAEDVETCTALYTIRATQTVGTYPLKVVFAADDNYSASTGTGTVLTVTEDLSSTVVTASPQNLLPGGTFTLSVTVRNTTHRPTLPTGTVTFTSGSTALGSCNLSSPSKNSSTCTTGTINASVLGAGKVDTITATYPGVPNAIAGSTGTTTVTLAADIVFTSVTHTFGTVPIGSDLTYGVKLTNNDSTAFPFALTLAGPSTFTSSTNCGTSVPGLAAGVKNYCEIVFTYTPTTATTQTATWSVGADGKTFSPSNGGTLTATGVAAAGVTLGTSGHDFGLQEIMTTSDVYGTVLTNATANPVALTFSQSETTDFAQFANNCPATLAAYQTCNLQYDFTPTTTGPLEDIVTITATQNGAPVTITANGVTVTGLTLTGQGENDAD